MVSCSNEEPLLSVICVNPVYADAPDVKQETEASYLVRLYKLIV
jgi:hypothetical protein